MDLNARGTRLWASLTAQDASLEDELNPQRETALTACRAADRLETLEKLAAVTDVVVEGRTGPVTHPVHVEVRQAAALLARLVAALRLPDEATGKRPQKRQVRGVQKPSAVSSLDRARAAKTGA
jgi:hypothetical protein